MRALVTNRLTKTMLCTWMLWWVRDLGRIAGCDGTNFLTMQRGAIPNGGGGGIWV